MHTDPIAGRRIAFVIALAAAAWLTAPATATAASTTLFPTADARVDASHAKRNLGRGVLRAGRSPLVRSYLKFDASGVKGTITRATLILSPESSSRSRVSVLSAGNRWSERNITFKNAPSPRTTAASSGRVKCCKGKLSLDVTRLVKDKTVVTLVLQSGAGKGSSDTVSFASRERGRRLKPRLVIESAGTGDSTTPTPAAPSPGTTTPTPTDAPAPTPFPSWNGDFSTGDWSQYDSRPDYSPDGRPQDFAIVTSPTPAGFAHAGAFTVGPNSIAGSEAGTRALTTLWPNDNPAAGKSRAYEGADSWYRDAFYLPASFTPAPNTAWNWLWEMHNFPDGPGDANLELGVVTDGADGGPSGGERLSLWVMGGASAANPVDEKDYWCRCNPDIKDRWMIGLSSVPRERWVDILIHVKWTYKQSGGLVEWWVDGKKVGSYAGPTLFYYKSVGGPGQGYLQHGYYRPRGSSLPTVTVYHGATMIGPSAASVGSTVG